jgi:hypothetical protein
MADNKKSKLSDIVNIPITRSTKPIDIPMSFICGLDSVNQIGFVAPKIGMNVYLVKEGEIRGDVKKFADSIKANDRIYVYVIPDDCTYRQYIELLLREVI